MAGFNDAKGLNGNAARNSPYPLGKNNAQGGFGERGWQGVWPAEAKATFVKDDVAEGDGAVHLSATLNYGRSWSKPQTGTFVVETRVRCPEGGGVQCYVWDANQISTGPMWRVLDGKLLALNGNGTGSGDWTEVAVCKTDTWHKVTLTIDVAKKRWSMAVDDTASDKQFAFRYDPTALRTINFLVEGTEQIYIDAIRILAADGKK